MNFRVSSQWVTAMALLYLVSANISAQDGICGVLVTELECQAHKDRLGSAQTAEERAAIQVAHALLLKERARYCHVGSASPRRMETEPFIPKRTLRSRPAQKIWM